MKKIINVEGEITEDGKLIVDIPPDAPRGTVDVVLRLRVSDEPIELSDDDLRGEGQTAQEIARAPEVGAWADSDIPSGARFVENLRRSDSRFSW